MVTSVPVAGMVGGGYLGGGYMVQGAWWVVGPVGTPWTAI